MRGQIDDKSNYSGQYYAVRPAAQQACSAGCAELMLT